MFQDISRELGCWKMLEDRLSLGVHGEFETSGAQERVIRSFERCEYARGEVVVKQGNEVTWGQMGHHGAPGGQWEILLKSLVKDSLIL